MHIDLSEKFQHFSHAPIVEAAVDLRAKPSVQWDQEGFRDRLTKGLPDYPEIQPQRSYRGKIKLEAGKPPAHQIVDLDWSGLQFRSKDKLQAAQFQKEGFAFSRLQSYQHWEQFINEALRLWKIFIEVMQPVAIQRIGVRFINKMSFPAEDFSPEKYLVDFPRPLLSLGFIQSGFLHRDAFVVPETNYLVNLIRAIQPADSAPLNISIILDIDVFTKIQTELRYDDIEKRLAEMRWLKNKIFCGSITEKAKELFL